MAAGSSSWHRTKAPWELAQWRRLRVSSHSLLWCFRFPLPPQRPGPLIPTSSASPEALCLIKHKSSILCTSALGKNARADWLQCPPSPCLYSCLHFSIGFSMLMLRASAPWVTSSELQSLLFFSLGAPPLPSFSSSPSSATKISGSFYPVNKQPGFRQANRSSSSFDLTGSCRV